MNEHQVTILSIDDDRQICYALEALFLSQGWKSVSAGNVAQGLKMFSQHHPDVVLIDYHMPGTNGIQGVQMLRALDPDVPIIVFTIEENQEVANEFLAAGASDFALKPIKAPDILSRINLHLRLLDQVRRRERGGQYTAKGIVPATQDFILNFLRTQTDFVTADAISEGTGLAYQTVSRYLQYLVQEKKVKMQNTYGKVGRPRQSYMIAE